VRRLRQAIERGFFAAGSRLLPSRELALRLGVSRNTVVNALEQLAAEGYLETRIGAGTFVTRLPRRPAPGPVARARALPQAPQELAAIERRLGIVGSSLGPLRVGAPDLSAFPMRAWRRLQRESIAVAESHLDYGPSAGLPALREAIAHHVAQFRGVVADAGRIVVVEGTQSALHLIAFALAKRGDRIAIEDPCYQLARAIFSAHGLALEGVAVDDHGLRTSELPASAALAYVTPSHQFPLGGALPLARRAALLDWANRNGAYVIEDDYDSEFCAHPLPALQSLDRNERVVYVGSFSKTLAPGLRLGYVVAPPHLAQTFAFARSVTTLGASAGLQWTVAEFIARNYFSRHVRRMTAAYERRRRVWAETLVERLPRGFRIGPAQTGLHAAVVGPPDFDDVLAANALPAAERVLPLSPLCIERTDCRGLVVGFSAGDDASIAHAARALARRL